MMTAQLALLCTAIVGSSLLGGALPLATVLTHARLQLYLSFSAGAMLGAAFCHMLPEAVELGSVGVLRWAAGGLLTLFILERFFAFHHHESPGDRSGSHDHNRPSHRGHAAGLVDASAVGDLGDDGGSGVKAASLDWGAAAFGLGAHSLIGGVALAGAVAADAARGRGLGPAAWGVFLATIFHKPADALTIVSLMMRAGVRRRVAHLVNLGFALIIPAGAALFGLGSSWIGAGGGDALTANALAFSAGTFLCIALSDLLPELQFHRHDRFKLTAALFAGFMLMAAVSGLESEAPPVVAPAQK